MSAWFKETRIAWIKESVEIWGYISRSQIMRKFDISKPQASHDLKLVQQRYPGLLIYDKSLKIYTHRNAPRRNESII